jgi:hypothetical protein
LWAPSEYIYYNLNYNDGATGGRATGVEACLNPMSRELGDRNMPDSLPGVDRQAASPFNTLQMGHLLGHQFGGIDEPENLVPEFPSANLGWGSDQMKRIEFNIRNALNENNRVYFEAIPEYAPNGYPGAPADLAPYIPSQIDITWGIAGAAPTRIDVPNYP